MNKLIKPFFGSIFPFIAITTFFIVMFPYLVYGEAEPTMMVLIFVPLAFLATIWTWVNIITYMIYALKHPKLFSSSGVMIAWVIAIYLLNIFIFPFFWFKYIRKQLK